MAKVKEALKCGKCGKVDAVTDIRMVCPDCTDGNLNKHGGKLAAMCRECCPTGHGTHNKATAEEDVKVKCDDCQMNLKDSEIIPLVDVVDLGDRLDPGSIVPVGECLICGALVYQSVPVEEAAAVPAVPVPDKSNGHICFVDGYEYFKYAGDIYQVSVASGFEWLGINEKTRPDVFYRRGARSYCTDAAWDSSPVARNIKKKEEAAGKL